MYKKVILIQVDSIIGYPPTLSLIHEISKNDCELTVITTCVNEHLRSLIPSNVKLVKVGEDYTYKSNVLKKLINLLKLRKELWKTIDELYDEDTILWVMSNITVKHLGGRLVNYNYNLHLFELVEKICYVNDKLELDLNLKKLAHCARNVIVCEYNRAQITQAWLRLDKLPLIVSNKPMPNQFERNSVICHSNKAKDVMDRLKGRKIILYQGVVDAERPIEPFAKTVEELGNEFAFVVMTGSNCSNLSKYNNTMVLPYIPAPYHLEVTSNASIGLLMYTAVYGQFTSPLNSIYCAPNKIYEFSQFGIPMIGNNIPGLKYTIDFNNMGVCIDAIDTENIKRALENIASNYDKYATNAKAFYESDNKEEVIKKALIKTVEK